MKNTKRTKIELEEREITIIRFNRKSAESRFCTVCETDARHLTLSAAARLLRISERTVFRLIENDLVHSRETASGALLICLKSLVYLFERLRNPPF